MAEIKFCGHCGEKLNVWDRNCSSCGETQEQSGTGDDTYIGNQLPRVGFVTAVNSAFVNFLNFSGRATRAEFWWYFLFLIMFGLVVGAAILVLPLQNTTSITLFGILALSVRVVLISLTFRRLHDRGRTGWWSAILIYGIAENLLTLPVIFENYSSLVFFALQVQQILYLPQMILVIVLIHFCAKQGQLGPNKYGPDPRTTSR